jgi:hypothetical protein
MVLSNDVVLHFKRRGEPTVYCISTGRFEDDGHHGLKIFDAENKLIDKIESGTLDGWMVTFGEKIVAGDVAR